MPSHLPRHIAVIMDGNGRWAKARGLPRIAGHRRGLEAARTIVPLLIARGIPYLTLFAFSSENWRRPKSEVRALVELLSAALDGETLQLAERDIRLRAIGDLSRFPKRLQTKIRNAIDASCEHRALNLTVAINYGGQWDVMQACRAIARAVEQKTAAADSIDAALIESHLCTRDLPPPDLFIRTGGEKRISNFLLWQLAYTELYFTDTHWPDFAESDLDGALAVYARRQRRFGAVPSGDEEVEVAAQSL